MGISLKEFADLLDHLRSARRFEMVGLKAGVKKVRVERKFLFANLHEDGFVVTREDGRTVYEGSDEALAAMAYLLTEHG